MVPSRRVDVALERLYTRLGLNTFEHPIGNIEVSKRRPMTPEEESLFSIDKLNVDQLVIPVVKNVDYAARVQTVHADFEHASPVVGSHRMMEANK